MYKVSASEHLAAEACAPALFAKIEAASRQLRDVALELDRTPYAAMQLLARVDQYRELAFLGIPSEYNPYPFRLHRGQVAAMPMRLRVQLVERLAYGDTGGLLALPGPAMSGQVVLDMGSAEQRRRYFDRIADARTHTFFALSEPAVGSDATRVGARYCGGLNGEKYFIGSGARASVGVAFVRTADGPLGLEAAIIDAAGAGFTATPLASCGVRGAALAHLRFVEHQIADGDWLGRHLPPTRRGITGALAAFNRFRPCVAAMACGVTGAALDYVAAQRRSCTVAERQRLDHLYSRLATMRRAVVKAGAEFDRDPQVNAVAGVIKVRAARLAEDATAAAIAVLGPSALLEHPSAARWYRDARAFEYMEGVSNVHRLNAFHSYAVGRLPTIAAGCGAAASQQVGEMQ